MKIMEKLSRIQAQIKVPKSQFNNFGGYKYRSCEDIVEAVKPLCKSEECLLTLSDELKEVGGRVYIIATATLTSFDGSEKFQASAAAREPMAKKGMDESQITGAASSYARKYALNGLFAIDDTKDADTMDNREHDVKIKPSVDTILKVMDETEKEELLEKAYKRAMNYDWDSKEKEMIELARKQNMVRLEAI